MERSEEILREWFAEADGDGWSFSEEREKYWFGKNAQVDADLRKRFVTDVERAAAGLLRGWEATPRGRLALIILLDQLPRNIHRGTPAAFAHDAQALQLARDGIDLGHDLQLRPIERSFFYLPFEHAEDPEAQAQAVRLYDALAAGAPPHARERFRVFLDYAVAHKKIIDRFGRFPHRNDILGRDTTDEEASFLKQPGSSF